MEALAAFAAALLALRLAGRLLARWRERRAPALAAWAASLGAYSVASAAMAAGAAAGWSDTTFRVYYLFGGLLTAPLLGVGSLLLRGWRWVAAPALVYVGLAVGLALAVPLAAPVGGDAIPAADEHLDFLPARLAAVVANVAGTVAVVAVAVASFRQRPLGNALVLAGVAVAAGGSALFGLGATWAAASVALAALLLYGGFVARPGALRTFRFARAVPHGRPRDRDERDERDLDDRAPQPAVRE